MPQSTLPPYVMPAAFTAVIESKENSTRSPYGNKVRRIKTYPKKSSKKPFQNQFKCLANKLKEWGDKYNINTEEMNIQSGLMQDQFFMPGYSDKQPPIFFETIKKNLESILLTLQDDTISLNKRINAYNSLCRHLGVCAPGLYTHIENIYFYLSSNISLSYWLTDFRTNLIRIYADRYNQAHHISASNSIHTLNAFTTYAKNQNWNPAFSTAKIDDSYISNLTENDLIDFHHYFLSEFNPTAIHDCIQMNLNIEMKKIFDSLGLTNDEWKSVAMGNYGEFINQAKNLLQNLGIKNDIYDFIELNEDDSAFRLHHDAIINILCEQILSPAVYYNYDKKTYSELVPYHWLDPEILAYEEWENLSDLPSVWNSVPDKDFPLILCRVLNLLSHPCIDRLLALIPYEKLEAMAKSESYATSIDTIEDSKKQTFIFKKVSEQLYRGEYKEEKKEEKIAYHHQFFQPVKNTIQLAHDATINQKPYDFGRMFKKLYDRISTELQELRPCKRARLS